MGTPHTASQKRGSARVVPTAQPDVDAPYAGITPATVAAAIASESIADILPLFAQVKAAKDALDTAQESLKAHLLTLVQVGDTYYANTLDGSGRARLTVGEYRSKRRVIESRLITWLAAKAKQRGKNAMTPEEREACWSPNEAYLKSLIGRHITQAEYDAMLAKGETSPQMRVVILSK